MQLPGQLTLRAQFIARTNTWRLTGAVTQNRVGVGGATVQIFRGTRANRLGRMRNVRSGANGSFATSGRLRPRVRTLFRARAIVPNRPNSTVVCAIALPLPPGRGGCVAAVYSGFTAQSAVVPVRPPRRERDDSRGTGPARVPSLRAGTFATPCRFTSVSAAGPTRAS